MKTNSLCCKFALAFLLLYPLLGCQNNDLKSTQKINSDASYNIESAYNIVVEYSENAKKTAELKAPLMNKELDSINKAMFPKGVHLDMYEQDGKLGSTLTAKYGEMDYTTNQMKARDSVVVHGTSGQSLRCADLIWIQNERRLLTYGSVALQTPTETIFGDTFTADENLRIYKIEHVTGIVQVKK